MRNGKGSRPWEEMPLVMLEIHGDENMELYRFVRVEYTCDECGRREVVGQSRYECPECENYVLCKTCHRALKLHMKGARSAEAQIQRAFSCGAPYHPHELVKKRPFERLRALVTLEHSVIS